jgi:hypothetical protein
MDCRHRGGLDRGRLPPPDRCLAGVSEGRPTLSRTRSAPGWSRPASLPALSLIRVRWFRALVSGSWNEISPREAGGRSEAHRARDHRQPSPALTVFVRPRGLACLHWDNGAARLSGNHGRGADVQASNSKRRRSFPGGARRALPGSPTAPRSTRTAATFSDKMTSRLFSTGTCFPRITNQLVRLPHGSHDIFHIRLPAKCFRSVAILIDF